MTSRNIFLGILSLAVLYILIKMAQKSNNTTKVQRQRTAVQSAQSAQAVQDQNILIVENPEGVPRLYRAPTSITRSQEPIILRRYNNNNNLRREVVSGDTYADVHPRVNYQFTNNQADQYDQYYIAKSDQVNNANTCIAIPQSSVQCINRQLVQNGNDIQAAISDCNLPAHVSTDCTKHNNGYYYPVPTNRPYVTGYADQQPRGVHVHYAQTSLNAPMERSILVGPGEGF